jgi:CHASE2 domain-containing sensor protein
MTDPRIIEFIYDLKRTMPMLQRVWAPLLAVVLGCATLISPLGWQIEILHLRGLFWLRGERPPPPDIVLVGLDQGTREAYGLNARTVLPRELIGRGLTAIADAGPRILIVDLCFPPQQGSAEADQMIASALRKVPSTIWNGDLGVESKESFQPDRIFADSARLTLSMGLPSSGVIINPLVRGAALPSVGQALSQLTSTKITPPLPGGLINFYGDSGAINDLTLGELLQLSADQRQRLFHDKVVIFGSHEGRNLRVGQAIGSDEHWVGGSFRQMSGAEIHATIAGNLIDGSWLRSVTSGTALLAIILGVGMAARILCVLPLRYALPGLAMVGVMLIAGSYYAFINRGEFRIGILSALLALAVTMTLNYLVLYRVAVARLVRVSLTAGLALATTIRQSRFGRSSAFIKPLFAALAVLVLSASGVPQWGELYIMQMVKGGNQRELTAPVVQVTFSDHTMAARKLSPGEPFPTSAVLPVVRGIAAQRPRLVVLDLGLVRPPENSELQEEERLRGELLQLLAEVPLVLWDGARPGANAERRVADPTFSPLYNSLVEVQAAVTAVADMSFAVRSGVAVELEAFKAVGVREAARAVPSADPSLERLFDRRGRRLLNPYGGGGIPRYDAALFYPGVTGAPELRDKIVVVGFASVARQRGSLESTKLKLIGMKEPVFAHDVTAIRTANLVAGDGTAVFDNSWLKAPFILCWVALMWAALFSGSFKWYPAAIGLMLIAAVMIPVAYHQFNLWIPMLAQAGAYLCVILVLGSLVGRSKIIGQFARIKRVIRVQLSEAP